MSDSNPQKFRLVNRILGSQPSLGPIPGNQVFPWTVILFISYTLGYNIIRLGWLNTLLMAAWLIGTWWILTGNQSWRFLSKFVPLPYVVRGHARYLSLLDKKSYERKSQKKAAKRRRKKGKNPQTLRRSD